MSLTETKQRPLSVYRRLLKATRPYIGLLVFGILATIARSGIDAGLTWSIKPLINLGFVHRNETFISLLPPIVILVFAFRGSMVFSSSYLISRVGRHLVMYYRQRLFDHFMVLPARFYLGSAYSRLLSVLVYNVEQVAEATSQALLLALRSVFTIIGFLAVMFAINWQLSLLFVLITPLMFGLIQITGRRLRRLNTKVQDMVGEVSNLAYQGLAGYREIRIYGGEAQERANFHQAARKAKGKELKVVMTSALGSASVQLVIAIPITIVLFLATMPNMNISAGSFAAMITSMLGLAQPFKRLSRINNKIQKGVAGAQSIYDLLDEPPERDEGEMPVERARGELECRNVDFAYSSDTELVLRNLSFKINQGEMVAFVGKSGAGKSTLANLLPRFFDPLEGEILLDGIDLKQYRLNDLRRQFALVSQDIVLFNATIADNIAFGEQSDARRDAIERAAQMACVTEFTNTLPDGLDTLVGDKGIALSGGQRQRIAIARAFLKDAPILLLDEATSALDMKTEKVIQKALGRLARDRTTIVIAHRLSTIQQADKIIVLSQGEIVESGQHTELVNSGGEYSELYSGLADPETVEL